MRGTAADRDTVVRVTWQRDGEEEREIKIRPDTLVSFAAQMELPTGGHDYRVHAYDARGARATSAPMRARRDDAAPTLELVSPDSGAFVASDTVVVTLRARDASGLRGAYLSSNHTGQLYQSVAGTDATYSFRVPLKAGKNVLYTTVNDQAGSYGSLWSVVYRNELRFQQVALGGDHSCALTPDGDAYCWGWNGSGEMGNPNIGRAGSPLPIVVAGGLRFTAITVGGQFSCALSPSREAYCWGSTIGSLPTRVVGDIRFSQLDAGDATVCGVATTSEGYCWGPYQMTPKPVTGGAVYRQVVTEVGATCAVRLDGRAFCWGSNGFGRLGTGDTITRSEPTAVASDRRFSAIAPGRFHSCGIVEGGEAFCWGNNQLGELGTGSYQRGTAPTTAPAPVRTPQRFQQIGVGRAHTCALATDGRPWCWGDDSHGQLGRRETGSSALPVAVDTPLRFTSLIVREDASCAAATSGIAYCWGGRNEERGLRPITGLR